MNKGIDVCTYQGVIDWARVKNDGVTFAMIKATQGRSEINQANRNFVDGKYSRNIAEAAKAGVSCGVYHYLTAATVAEAHAEAKLFLNAIVPYKDKITLFAAVDVESKYLPQNKRLLTEIVSAFYSDVEKAGFRCAVYTNPSFLKYRLNDIGDKRLWLALWRDRSKTPTGYKNLVMWQWGTSKVAGIAGEVDSNLGFFEKDKPVRNVLKVGDRVRVKKAVLYNSNRKFLALLPTYRVIRVTGDRVVIGFGSLVIAAVNADNLTRV